MAPFLLFDYSVKASAAVCASLFIQAAGATDGSIHQAPELARQPMFGINCLPGPLQFDTFPTCVMAGGEGDEPWAPWTYRPYCTDNTTYCVFTHAHFQGPNRGVSIIDVQPSGSDNNTTSAVTSIAEFLSSLGASHGSQDDGHEEQPSPFEVRDIPGKGKGLIATRKIRRGHVFMVDHAAVVADVRLPTRIRRAEGLQLLKEAVERLPGADEVLNLARSSRDPENVPVFEDVIRTNSFTVEIAGKDYMVLFPRIARMNHACKPSAITRFNSTTLSNTVTAFRDIQPGEEITISYASFGLPSQVRKKKLLSNWGFNCTCDLCSLPPDELAASDERRTRISLLSKEVIDLVERGGKENMKKAAGLYGEAVDAVRVEGLVPHLGSHYQVLGQLWAAAGDVDKGKEFIKRAKEETAAFEESKEP